MSEETELFPTIGNVADQADLRETIPDGAVPQETDGDDKVVQEIESLCMKCREQVRCPIPQSTTSLHTQSQFQGTTRLLLTSIPFFREVIVMSFRCDHCGATNNEIQSAGTIRRASFSMCSHSDHIQI